MAIRKTSLRSPRPLGGAAFAPAKEKTTSAKKAAESNVAKKGTAGNDALDDELLHAQTQRATQAATKTPQTGLSAFEGGKSGASKRTLSLQSVGANSAKEKGKLGAGGRGAKVGVATQSAGPSLGKRLGTAAMAAIIGLQMLGGVATAQADTLTQTLTPPTTIERTIDSSQAYTMRLPDLGSAKVVLDQQKAPKVDAAVQKAFDTFNTQIVKILHHDAASMANLQTPWQPGDAVTDAQQTQMETQLKTLLKSIPAGALNQSVLDGLRTTLNAAGADTKNLETTKLGDLHQYGSEIARNLLKDLRTNHPGAFYGAATAAAAAIGYVGYTQGTDALQSIGVKPEIKTSFFNNSVSAKLKTQFEARLANPNVSLELGSQHRFGNGVTLQGSATLNGSGTDFSSMHLDGYGLNASVTQGNQWWAKGDANIQGNQLQSGHLSGGFRLTNPNIVTNADVHYDANTGIDAGLSARYQVDSNLFVSGGARRNFQDGQTTGNLSLGYQPQDNIDIQLRGSVNQAGNAQVGVGLTRHF